LFIKFLLHDNFDYKINLKKYSEYTEIDLKFIGIKNYFSEYIWCEVYYIKKKSYNLNCDIAVDI